MSDDIDAAYEKYLRPHTDVEIESKVTCPNCESENVDCGAGYRGEYTCNDCGHHWQVGGLHAS